MLSVASVVVWSSMSTVTVVPTIAAASHTWRADSSAIFSPSRGSRCPNADSFTDTSTRPARPSSPSRRRSVR